MKDKRIVADCPIKAAFLCPCIGVGGADGYMMGIIDHTPNIEWTGVAVERNTTKSQWNWVRQGLKRPVEFHQPDHGDERFPFVNYHENGPISIYEATKDADILVLWCSEFLDDRSLACLDKPIIELTQNTDNFARQCTQNIDHLVNYRVACCKAAIETYPEKRRDTVQVIYNAIDATRIVPRYGRSYYRNSWNIPEHKKIVLFMSRFVDEKNPQTIISAVRELGPDYVALFVGDGYRENDLYLECQRYLEPGQAFFMDAQYHVGDILAASDVLVLPSDFEGMPLTLLEAWLAGLPTVCSRFTNALELREIFGDLSIYVPRAPSTYDVVEGIKTALSEEAIPIQQNARHTVWNNFTIPTVAVHWEDLIQKCLYDWRKRKRQIHIHPVKPSEPMDTSSATVKVISR